MNLVIVESPTKAKTISRFLGSGFIVKSSFGHVRDLPKSRLGIDVEHNFKPHYLVSAKAKKVITELKEALQKVDTVILAPDPDREGEAIAWHLSEALKLNEGAHPKKVERVVFHEITKTAIQHALESPRTLDMHLVDAQQARRVLDRLVGYELSPFLWKKIRFGLSAGRVQSVAVRLVVEREREIQQFKQEEYWSIEARFKKDGETLEIPAKLIRVDDTTLEKLSIKNETEAKKLVDDIKQGKFHVANVTVKETKRHPSPPFTTSTLQQEAARKLGFSAKQTMALAQQLYEGIDIGEGGATGLITYMRTDSVNMAEIAISQAEEMVTKHFGKEYSAPKKYQTKSKGAQEAHEAVRPSHFNLHPEDVKKYLERAQFKLYELIWKRAIASQMKEAIFDQTSIDILATHTAKPYTFRANGQVMKFDGFIKAYMEDKDEADEEDLEGQLPELEAKDPLNLQKLDPLQHFTEPPPRYSDATLIKVLEANGIGRPSTYAPIITTIQDRGYVEKLEKRFHPTEIGFLVNDMLVQNFPEIVDVNFTSHIEEQLDDIAEGKIEWEPVIAEFYTPFKKNLVEKEASVKKLIQESTTPCPHCGKNMMIKYGRMGKFLACPEEGSTVTMPLPEEAAQIKALEEKTKDERCPICSKPMEVKRGRFGYFLGCSDYPNCKGIAKIVTRTGYKCPNCQTGDLLERKSRGRGKLFYGCSRFPECNFVTNKKPESQEELQQLFEEWKANPPKPRKSYAKKKTTE